MKERPILFSAPMIRAILAGTKTQTRRVIKRAVGPSLSVGIDDQAPGVAELSWLYGDGPGYEVHEHVERVPCPYGAPGDRLWCKETWTWNGGMGSSGRMHEGLYDKLWVTYAADGVKLEINPVGPVQVPKQPPQRKGEVYSLQDAPDDFEYDGENTYTDRLMRWWNRKIPAIHMPRWASRITLEVTGVRVERLQDISEADCQAEGIESYALNGRQPTDGNGSLHLPAGYYRYLWESINGPGSWDANPHVWVIEFKRVTPGSPQ